MRFFYMFLSLIFIGCSSSMNNSQINYKVLYSGQNSSIENKEFLLIENNTDYITVIEKLNIDESDYDNLLNVNFKSNNVCILFLGERNTGGYSLQVDSIIKKEKTLFITTKENKPEKHSNVTNVITHPFCIISIPKYKNIVVK